MEEKKTFKEKYAEWKERNKKFGEEHYYLGYPVRHPSMFLFILFLLVTLVCGICNVAVNRRNIDEELTSKVEHSIQNAPVPVSYMNYVYPYALNGLQITNDYGNSSFDVDNQIVTSVTGVNKSTAGNYINSYFNRVASDFDYNYFASFRIDLASTYTLDVDMLYSLSVSSDKAVDVYLSVSDDESSESCYIPATYTLTTNATYYVFNLDASYTYRILVNSSTSSIQSKIKLAFSGTNLTGGYLMASTVSRVYFAYSVMPSYYDFFNNVVGVGYQTGYNAGYDYGFEQGEIQGHNIGYSQGYQLGNSKDMTLTTLFWNVIDEPFAVIYRLLNFDVLGVNIFAFVMGLVTIGLIGFIIKLVI